METLEWGLLLFIIDMLFINLALDVINDTLSATMRGKWGWRQRVDVLFLLVPLPIILYDFNTIWWRIL